MTFTRRSKCIKKSQTRFFKERSYPDKIVGKCCAAIEQVWKPFSEMCDIIDMLFNVSQGHEGQNEECGLNEEKENSNGKGENS